MDTSAKNSGLVEIAFENDQSLEVLLADVAENECGLSRFDRDLLRRICRVPAEFVPTEMAERFLL